MPTFGYGETVTVYTSTVTTDRYGNDTRTWAAANTYQGVVISARTSDEVNDRGRQGVIIGLRLMFPVGAVIGPHDRAEVRGEMYEVVGEPFTPHSPFTGLEPGVSVAVQRVTG